MSILKDKEVLQMEISEALKKIRKQYKMTQEDVANFLGISRSGYTYYETGKSMPSIEVLKKLSAIYDTTIDEVVGNRIKNQSSKYGKSAVMEDCPDPLMYMKKEEQQIVMAYRLLDDNEKEMLKDFAVKMLSEKSEQE